MQHIYVTTITDFKFDVIKLIEEFKIFDKEFGNSFDPQGMARKLHLVRFGKYYPKFLDKLPYTQEVLSKVKLLFNFDCVTYRVLFPKKCYDWHIDPYLIDHCYHIPLITNSACEFVYEGNLRYRLPVGQLYRATTDIGHTFENNGLAERVHITFEKQLS